MLAAPVSCSDIVNRSFTALGDRPVGVAEQYHGLCAKMYINTYIK